MGHLLRLDLGFSFFILALNFSAGLLCAPGRVGTKKKEHSHEYSFSHSSHYVKVVSILSLAKEY